VSRAKVEDLTQAYFVLAARCLGNPESNGRLTALGHGKNAGGIIMAMNIRKTPRRFWKVGIIIDFKPASDFTITKV
jgi:hypothetical protein